MNDSRCIAVRRLVAANGVSDGILALLLKPRRPRVVHFCKDGSQDNLGIINTVSLLY
ncbi:MAG: hypothetical protein NNA18_09150 [Nitrospira sp.]|nr:hypothetical protein [Nitrospira sp.]